MPIQPWILPTWRANILRIKCIGYVCGILVTVILFCHLYRSYRMTFNRADAPTSKNKSGYILVMVYLLSACITCIIFTFIRTNTLTGLNDYSFTYSRCMTGVFLFYVFSAINYIMIGLIFLHRIHTIFKSSAYEYKSYVYKGYFIFIVLSVAIPTVMTLFALISKFTKFNLKVDNDTGLSFCASNAVKMLPIWISLSVAILQPVASVGLLSMFIKGLWSLNKNMMVHFLKEHTTLGNQLESRSNSSVDVKIEPDISINATNTNLELTDITPECSQIRVTMDIVLDEWTRQATVARDQLKPEIERIVRLHNLIKKQTVLVCIATISTIMTWIGASIHGSILLGAGWDIVLNAFCVWMMLDTSKKYWHFCKLYGFCWCCYWKVNKIGM